MELHRRLMGIGLSGADLTDFRLKSEVELVPTDSVMADFVYQEDPRCREVSGSRVVFADMGHWQVQLSPLRTLVG